MANNQLSPLADLQRQNDLLRMEYTYEKELYRQQAESMGLRKRIARGICWYPVAPGRSYYNSLNQLVMSYAPCARILRPSVIIDRSCSIFKVTLPANSCDERRPIWLIIT